jgi:hypothetical protein
MASQLNGVEPTEFIDLYLEIARLAEPKLEWQWAQIEYKNIAGYGIYA